MDRQAVIGGLQKTIEDNKKGKDSWHDGKLTYYPTKGSDNVYLIEAIKFLREDEKLRKDLTKFLEQENPYPEKVFMVIRKEDLDKINDFFKKELGYPMDRLSGSMGRAIYESITGILRGMIK